MTALPAQAVDRSEPVPEQPVQSPAQEGFGGGIERELSLLQGEEQEWLDQPYMTGNRAGCRSARSVTLAALLRVRPHRHAYAQVGVSNGAINNDGRQGTNFNVKFSDGALIIAEAGYHTELPAGHVLLPGHFKIGGYHHTGRFCRFDAPAGSDLPSDVEHRTAGWYVLLDHAP